MIASLRESFGILILPKDTILYAVGQYIGKQTFLLHPSEYPCIQNHLSVQTIILTRDVSLLCLIKSAYHGRLFSAQTVDISALEAEQLDGWITSICNRDTVKIQFSNSINPYTIQNEESLIPDWRFVTIHEGKIIPKIWGTRYPLSKIPAQLKTSNEMKIQFKDFQTYNKDEQDNAFAILLSNAII